MLDYYYPGGRKTRRRGRAGQAGPWALSPERSRGGAPPGEPQEPEGPEQEALEEVLQLPCGLRRGQLGLQPEQAGLHAQAPVQGLAPPALAQCAVTRSQALLPQPERRASPLVKAWER